MPHRKILDLTPPEFSVAGIRLLPEGTAPAESLIPALDSDPATGCITSAHDHPPQKPAFAIRRITLFGEIMKPASLFLLVSALPLAGCYHMLREDGEIKVYESPTLVPPHGSQTYRYEIGGRSYAGASLEYLRIPEKHVVVFKTETLLDGEQLHVVPTKPGVEEFKVKIEDPGPGVWAFPLGLGSPIMDVTSTRVESIQGDVICFVTTMYSYKGKVWRTYLDLKKHTLSQMEPLAP